MDIRRSMTTNSCGGIKYFLAMTAGAQKYVRVYFQKNRSNVKGYYEKFVNGTEKNWGKKVGRIHIDNTTDLTQMKEELGRIFIILITSSLYTSQYNSLAESMNMILTKKRCVSLALRGLKKTNWGEAVRYADDLPSRVVKSELGSKTPINATLRMIPDTSEL